MRPLRASGWDVGRAAASLAEIGYFERAAAHVIAGWIAKIPDMAIKVELGEHLHRSLDRAAHLSARLSGLTRACAAELPVRAGWQRMLRRVDEAPDGAAMLSGLYRVLRPRVVSMYRAHVACADPVGDAVSVHLLTRCLHDVSSELEWSEQALSGQQATPGAAAFARDIEALWEARAEGPDVPFGDSLWRPVDRVPAAARPAGLERCVPGSLGVLAIDSLQEPQDVARFLHSELDEEYTTLELMARCSYEHPDMPWAFHADMARQAADEARHARLMDGLLRDRGLSHGAFPVDTSTYDGLYEFEPCQPGSRQELLWRLLLRQTFMEGLALDSLAHDIDRRARVGQHDIVHALEYILRDEVFHVRSGMRWSAFLLGEDRRAVLQARSEALAHYTSGAEALRERFVLENLEKAMAELLTIEEAKRRRGGKPPERPLNRVGRVQAGMSDEDILQVLSWGYATERPGA